jgi:hypothetical protein
VKQSKGQCEQCLPDATVWATSTPIVGPKSYFILIKDGEVQIPLEIKVDNAGKGGKAVTADVYTPQDYDYTIHDACNHDEDECIEDDPDFQEKAYLDSKLFNAGYKRAEE